MIADVAERAALAEHELAEWQKREHEGQKSLTKEKKAREAMQTVLLKNAEAQGLRPLLLRFVPAQGYTTGTARQRGRSSRARAQGHSRCGACCVACCGACCCACCILSGGGGCPRPLLSTLPV